MQASCHLFVLSASAMVTKTPLATCNNHRTWHCTKARARRATCPSLGSPVTRCKRSATVLCRAAAGGQPGVLLTPYELIETKNTYSIRLYTPHIVARTRYERRDEGFLRLGRYFDENRLQQTQPIVMRYPLQARSCCCCAVRQCCMPQQHCHVCTHCTWPNRCHTSRAARPWSCTSEALRCFTL